jgi:uncharacterized protein DUF998
VERTAPDIHGRAARVSLGFGISFLVLLSLLQVLEPELRIGHLIGEFERTPHGWLMSLAFLTLGISSATSYLAIRRAVTGAGQLAAGWLCVIAVAYAGAAMFRPDSADGFVMPEPVTPSPVACVHALCGLLIMTTSPIAFTMLSRSLAHDRRWHNVARRVDAVTFLAWFGLVSFVAALVVFGVTQPRTLIWIRAVVFVSAANRVLVVTYCLWLIVMALSALDLQRAAASK